MAEKAKKRETFNFQINDEEDQANQFQLIDGKELSKRLSEKHKRKSSFEMGP